MFNGYLDAAQSQQLLQAAVQSGLVDESRTIRTDGISPGFVATVRRGASALAHFQFELIAFNRVERLLDGTVPLAIFLTNCANLLKIQSRHEATLFAELANKLGNDTSGTSASVSLANVPPRVHEEAVIGRDEMLDFSFFRKGLAVGQSVGRLVVPRFDAGVQRKLENGQPWCMSGTAWMIAEGHVITNHHVINARTAGEAAAGSADFTLQAAAAVLEFDFDAPDAAKVKVKVEKLCVADRDLDYAVLKLAGPGRAPVRLAPTALMITDTSWEPVNIVQHPGGGYKKIGIRSNIATAATDQEVRYFTDTDVGSSGSPVCDDNWRVVALHRGAVHVTNVKFQGKDTAYVNFGSQMSAVLASVNAGDAALGALIAAANH